MANDRDGWKKPRSNGNHLTVAEIEFVKIGYRSGQKIRDVARDLKCASRTIAKYYGLFKAEGMLHDDERRNAAELPRDRFYKPNFEL